MIVCHQVQERKMQSPSWRMESHVTVQQLHRKDLGDLVHNKLRLCSAFLWRWWPTTYSTALAREPLTEQESNSSLLFGTPEAASWVQCLVLGHQDKKQDKILKKDHQRATTMVRRPKHTLYKRKLKEFGLFSMEKRKSRENLITDLLLLNRGL